jgi:predicted thioesterase
MLRRQLIGHRRGIATGADLTIEAQLAADLADRTQRVNPLEFDRGAIVDDLRIGHARHDRQVLTARHIGGKRQETETTQRQQTERTHR